MNIPRIPAKHIVLSAAALLTLIVAREDIRLDAFIPVKGDVLTIAAGTTVYPDGRPVKLGDKVTPRRALELTAHDVDLHTRGLYRCLQDIPLYQHEFDAYAAMAHNVGYGAVCRSSIVQKMEAGQYMAACATIKDFVCGPATDATKAKPGEKCYSKTKKLRVLRGLVNAREREYQWCMGKTQP